VLSFARETRDGIKVSTVKGNPGAGANLTFDNYATPGDDSIPLPGDDLCAVNGPKTGTYKAVGYLDPQNEQKSSPGEARKYGRDSSGVEVSNVWLKNDGSVTLSNDEGSAVLQADGSFIITTPIAIFSVMASGGIKGENGSGFFELLPSGDFVANNFTSPVSGNTSSTDGFTAPSMVVNGKELAEHTHLAGIPPGNTGVNN
jgi:hypothetical protein